MKYQIIILAGFLLFGCSPQNDETFRMPAEWEPQEAVWLSWFGQPRQDRVTVRIIEALKDQVNLKMIYTNDSILSYQKQFIGQFGVNPEILTYIKDPIQKDMYFIRDPGPIFLKGSKGGRKLADFAWNNYGNSFIFPGWELNETHFMIDNFSRRIGELYNIASLETHVVAEGGSIESNGSGTILSIKETAMQRNPDLTIEEVEAEYFRMTGSSKIIWLPKSVLHDLNSYGPGIANFYTSGANGHIDEMARFVNKNTILLAQISEEERYENALNNADFEILEDNNRILNNATDQDGNPFNIIRLPYPDVKLFARKVVLDEKLRDVIPNDISMFDDGDTLIFTRSTSYMNFFISNKVVLLPFYWQEGVNLREKEKDEKALKIFSELFPNKQIIQINPFQINRGGGGIHCATQPEYK